ncbi:MAG: uroporphyrinogen decarboxylase family protein [Lachnospiraceae bacterium]|nr:uroporphyrinogen decarboxylase family protein [Lachnospiraceae bacterium]
MNARERVMKILNHEEADRVPVYPICNSISWRKYGIGYDEWTKDPEKCADAIIKTTEDLGLDVIVTLVDLSVEAADWGMDITYYPDKAVMPSGDTFIKTLEDYEKVVPINPRKTERMSKMIELTKILVEKKGKEYPIIAFVFGPMGILSMMTGLEGLMMHCMKKKMKDKVKEKINVVTDVLIEYSNALIEAGADGIMYDTLYSSKTIMRASMWDEFEGAALQRLAENVHRQGKAFMIHNCGDGIYFKEQIARMHPEAISMLYLPPDCGTMEELKEKYGSQTTIIGHIDPGFLMVADDERLRKLCREQIDAYKKDGGFILATGCEYPALMDDHFARVMVEEANTYGKY